MKKLLCALLALAMLCACAAAEEADVTGTWYLAEGYIDGVSLNPIRMGMEGTMILRADGTVDMDLQWVLLDLIAETGIDPFEEEPPAEIRWKMDGGKVILINENNETTELTLVDGSLVHPLSEGDSLVFGREKPAANYFDPGAPLADAALEDFDGTWNATVVNFAGMEVTVGEMLLEITVELSGGSGTITDSSYGIDEPITYAVTGELVDGVLTVTKVEPETDEASIMTFTLCDSGVMVYSSDSLLIYFERAEGAEE